MGLGSMSDQDSAATKMLGADIDAPNRGGETMDGKEKGKPEWLKLARQAHEQSKNYYETHLRQEWKSSIAHFHSEHAPGSKYHKVEYAKRSRAFRPKTRSMVLRKESAAAGAFFASDDACAIEPVDPDSQRGLAAAAVTNAILNHRLKVDVPWFQILQGNYQTAIVQAVCASKQYWDYEAKFEDQHVVTPVLDEQGQPVMGEDGQPKVDVATEKRPTGAKVDKPCIVPIPPENLRFHPNADWLDPVNDSPYLVYVFPMFALDVKARAERDDPKTHQQKWKPVSDSQLMQAARLFTETLNVRDQNKRRESEQQAGGELKDFDTVWVHENFIKKDGIDYQFYTLGTIAMLSDPVPIEQAYLHGIRPFQVGIASLEAFTPFPQSKVQQLAQLQRLANETSNQRIDNVRLAMNGRYWVKEGRKIDLQVLSHSTPGSVVLMGDPQTDVKWDRPADVTQSAYQEQDRINADFDDLGGLFSTSTVQSDNHLNETLGGMKLMSNDAGAVQEYELRIFAVTYVEPVLRQMVKLIQAYETDQQIIALGGKIAQSFTKFGVDPIQDDLMNEELLVSVSVGVGATAPAQRMKKLTEAIDALWKMVTPLIQTYGPQVIQSPGVKAMAAEIFGAAGYKDPDKFLNFGPPQPPPGQGQGQDPHQSGTSPEQIQLADKAMQIEQGEKEADRAARMAETRVKDAGQTTRTIIQAHKDMIIKGIQANIKGRSGPDIDFAPVANDAQRMSA